MVDINFRLNSTGAYSDIILPTATWYEKNDLNTTDMHPFIHPLGEAVTRAGSRSPTGRSSARLAKTFTALGRQAPGHPQGRGRAADAARLADQELATPWRGQGLEEGRVRSDPGQDHAAAQGRRARLRQIYNKFIALGPLMVKLGNNVKGIDWNHPGVRRAQELQLTRCRSKVFPRACRRSRKTSTSATR